MKLYTEEQVRKAINDASLYSYINGDFEFKNSEDDIVNSLIPIELPTDEEIQNYVDNELKSSLTRCFFMEGAKWMREQLRKKQ